MIERSAIPKRFYSLDVLRGIAAIVVVITHWPQFFFSEEKISSHPVFSGEFNFIPDFDTNRLPFFNPLYLFYADGWMAVDLFFGLSGFIFFWLYAEKINNGKISAQEFFMLRFSRLYPLHFLTLIWVIALQFFTQHALDANYVMYERNTLPNFIQNVFLISSWWPGARVSFNLPIWSVSVEVALYGIFFFLCRYVSLRNTVLVTISLVGIFVIFRISPHMGEGIFSFFLGCGTYRVYAWIVETNRVRTVLIYLGAITTLLWLCAVFAIYQKLDILGSIPFFWRYTPLPAALIFVLTILMLALAETLRGTLGKRLMVLGDISYSVYLLHFPIQISALTMAIYFGISREVFYSHYAFFGFFALVLTLSALSHYYFERPVQKYMRKAWLIPSR